MATVYVSDLTISLRTVENSPAKDLSNSRSSQRDALNSISKGLKPLFAILFTVHRRYESKMLTMNSKKSIKFVCVRQYVYESVWWKKEIMNSRAKMKDKC